MNGLFDKREFNNRVPDDELLRFDSVVGSKRSTLDVLPHLFS